MAIRGFNEVGGEETSAKGHLTVTIEEPIGEWSNSRRLGLPSPSLESHSRVSVPLGKPQLCENCNKRSLSGYMIKYRLGMGKTILLCFDCNIHMRKLAKTIGPEEDYCQKEE